MSALSPNRFSLKTLCLAVAAAASAQVAAQSDAPLALEEVVVTAQKREQSLQDVPVSVTAFTEDVIDRAGISDFSGYAIKTPNVGFQQRGNRADTKFGIRGVTNIGGQASAVGIYVDEFNVVPNVLTNGTSRTADTSLLDIERIEVLRGPQGTFFGRNTMGGAINITTAKPDVNEAFGKVTLEAGEYGHYLAKATGNVPLGDTLALRGAAYYDENDGYIDNKGPSDASNAEENQGIRAALRWEPNSALVADFSVSWSEMQQDYPAMVPTGILGEIPGLVVEEGGFLFPTFGLDPWPLQEVPFYPDNYTDTATDLGRGMDSETAMVTARIEYDFDTVTLTSVTGYIKNDYDMAGEGDASSAPAFTVSRDSDMEAFSQEFRLASNANESVHWMVGFIYADDETNETDLSTHLESDPYLAVWDVLGILEFGLPGDVVDIIFNGPSGISVGNFEDVDRGSQTKSYAVFGDLTWDISEQWSLSGGLRYTYDDVEYYELTRPTITIPVSDISDSETFDDISPRLNLTWFPAEDWTVYGTISKGYKVGGFNASQDLVELTFDEETGWNYEVGFKSSLWDSRMQFNAAAFYFDWSDLQVRGQDVRTQRQIVVNAEEAHTQGVELEVKALLTEGLTLDVAYGYLEAEFDKFDNAIDTNGALFNANGNTIPLAPENTFTAGLEYQFDLGAGEAWARVDYSFIDDQFASADNTPERAIDSYELWNVRVGYDAEHWGVQAFVENLADEEYSSAIENLETFYTGFQRTVGKPRWAGVRLDIKF
ncbi:TonB-dependent receptor [Pseudohalioglobus sediminis]|nr:TonB-dependent receptor [Pseudohalioglobus sediminis]